jgi:hypothetical protein
MDRSSVACGQKTCSVLVPSPPDDAVPRPRERATGELPNLSCIVPNECHDSHTINSQTNTYTKQQPEISNCLNLWSSRVVVASESAPVGERANNASVIRFAGNDSAGATRSAA